MIRDDLKKRGVGVGKEKKIYNGKALVSSVLNMWMLVQALIQIHVITFSIFFPPERWAKGNVLEPSWDFMFWGTKPDTVPFEAIYCIMCHLLPPPPWPQSNWSYWPQTAICRPKGAQQLMRRSGARILTNMRGWQGGQWLTVQVRAYSLGDTQGQGKEAPVVRRWDKNRKMAEKLGYQEDRAFRVGSPYEGMTR